MSEIKEETTTDVDSSADEIGNDDNNHFFPEEDSDFVSERSSADDPTDIGVDPSDIDPTDIGVDPTTDIDPADPTTDIGVDSAAVDKKTRIMIAVLCVALSLCNILVSVLVLKNVMSDKVQRCHI